MAARTFKWPSVGGNPDLNFVVWQVGTTLYFADDVETPADSLRSFTLDLTSLATPEGFVATDVVDMAHGRGHLLLVSATLEPQFVAYDPDTDTIEANRIEIRERDFKGVEDGLSDTATSTTLADEYLYNLLNAGWKYADLTSVFTDKGYYPSKNMVYYLGYRRQEVAGFNPDDGTKQFSSDKLVAELFQDAPAPKGHFIVSPFNRSVSLTTDPGSTAAYITSWDPPDPNSLGIPSDSGGTSPALSLVTVTTDIEHGFTAGGTFTPYTWVHGWFGKADGGRRHWGIGQNGWSYGPTAPSYLYTVENVISTTSFTFRIAIYDDGAGWSHSYGGTYYYPGVFFYPGNSLSIDDALATDFRPSATAFFAGRAWYSGVPVSFLSDCVYFSQVVESDTQYGKCYQVADPTSENISDLTPTDGGVIHIPESGRVLKMVPYSSSLLVYASNGIWQIGPGSSGYFAADSYSVKKISDAQCTSGASVIDAEGTPIVWALAGIYGITQDPNSGYLVAQSLTTGKIDTYYTNILESAKRGAQGAWDTRNKRAVWVYPEVIGESTLNNNCLVYDAKFDAFTPWHFAHTATEVATVFTTRDTTEEGPPAVRFLCTTADGDIIVASLSNTTDYEDLDSAEADSYIVTGYDVAQNPQRYKHAPIITCFLKRTETGFTDLGGGDLVPVNESGVTMQARWDWADNSVAGKWGTAQQVYRHRRMYTPEDADDTFANGHPVVVTRNKVRGRGRSLHLKFTAEAGKDAHLLGWATDYQVLTDNQRTTDRHDYASI